MVRIEKVIKPIHLFLKLKKFFGVYAGNFPAMDFDKIAALKFLPGSNQYTFDWPRRQCQNKIIRRGRIATPIA